MQLSSGFNDISLRDVLEALHSGEIQVPTFQRAFTLTDAWLRYLLASVSQGYSIGAVMLLEAGHPEYVIPSFALPGAPAAEPPAADVAPRYLLVDGQHRMAALYGALRAGQPVPLADSDSRSYFLDCLTVTSAVDRDAAVFSLPRREEPPPLRPSFPLALTFGPEAELAAWRATMEPALLRRFEVLALHPIRSYRLPVIRIPQDDTRWTIRVRGGANGPALSDEYRSAPG